ncbi:hypothetical protein AB4Y30_01065 [Ornithinibacillus sp. 4-3]|uniref:DUF4367 domain-containing protein n=1 Tax=Ornithinibacillus sp. 4-3 TaxID=3231488 RepID=A0AB39HR34_9BACI
MSNEIKREMKKIDIPKNLHEQTILGVKQAKQEHKKGKRLSKWILSAAAFLIIVGGMFTVAGSPLTEAMETLLGKFIGKEIMDEALEIHPEEFEMAFPQMEQHLKLAEEHLSPEDFEKYGQLIKEHMEILLNWDKPDANRQELEKREEELIKELEKYGIDDLTTHTLEEAQAMVDYTLKYPTYLPEGYEVMYESITTDEANVGKDPLVLLGFVNNSTEGTLYTLTRKIDTEQENELEWYAHIDTYQHNGYTFEHAYDEIDGDVQGMRVQFPEEEYEIIIHSSVSKEEMEKVLMSMIE